MCDHNIVKNSKFNNFSPIWKTFIVNFTDKRLRSLFSLWPQNALDMCVNAPLGLRCARKHMLTVHQHSRNLPKNFWLGLNQLENLNSYS